MAEIIKALNVYKAYRSQPVLKGLTFNVKEGEIVGLLGPNGSGKTTTIRLLNGVINQDKGEIEVLGLDPQIDGDKARKLTGVLTESAGLYPHLSGEENLRFFGELYNIKDDSHIETLLRDFGLYEHKDKKVGVYSTGMTKRLGIAKALLHNPKLLFLDEPTTGLDPEGARDLLSYIERLNKEKGVTILICTHILGQIETLCDRFLFLDTGKIIEEGSLSEIESRYLTEFLLKIETDINLSDLPSEFELVESSLDTLIFKLPTKEEIPKLLRALLEKGSVYSCEILGRDLETMYFKIRGKNLKEANKDE